MLCGKVTNYFSFSMLLLTFNLLKYRMMRCFAIIRAIILGVYSIFKDITDRDS